MYLNQGSFRVCSSHVSMFIHIYVCIYVAPQRLSCSLLLGPITATWVALETQKFCCLSLLLLLLLDLLLCTCMRCLAYPAC